jgi:hypothetical protein
MRKRRNPRFRALLIAFIAFAISLAATLSGCDLPPIYEYWDSIVLNELEISPSFIALQEGQKATFSVIGGKVPYSFEFSGDGAITNVAGHRVEYSAPLTDTVDWITVRDIYDAQSQARVMVEANISQLTVVPSSAALLINESIILHLAAAYRPIHSAASPVRWHGRAPDCDDRTVYLPLLLRRSPSLGSRTAPDNLSMSLYT